MKILLANVLIFLVMVLSGCATSINTYDKKPISEKQAIVLVGVDSDIRFLEARNCSVICTAWYQLGGRKEIMAYPVNVGSTFKLNSIYTMDNRVAPLDGHELKLDQSGVYYYGTIISTYSKVGIISEQNPRLLLAAKRKYGNRFDNLKAVNFSWPNASDDQHLGISYQNSNKTQETLISLKDARLHLAKVTLVAKFHPSCRSGAALSLPDFLPYEEYIQRAFNQELNAAQIHDTNASTQLTGAVTELAFSSAGRGAHWKMGLRIDTPDGRTASAKVAVPFKATLLDGGSACSSAEDAVPNTVQKLIETLVESPEFKTLTVPISTTK